MKFRLSRLLVVLLGITAVLALAPGPALAADLRQGSAITVPPGQTVRDDLYVGAGTVDVSGTVDGSLLATGGTITMSGTITRDLMVAGGTVTVSGPVRGSIRVAGGNVTVTGPVGEDVVMTGGTLDLGSPAKVGRDVVVSGGSATVAGTVGRNVVAGVGSLILRGSVGGNVDASINELRVEDGARITGNLTYTSDNRAVVAGGATISGAVRHNLPAHPSPAQRFLEGLVSWIRTLVGLFALGLILTLLFPRFTEGVTETLRGSPWASLGIGLALLIGVPIIALIAFGIGLFAGGWWLGLAALGLYGLAVAAGYVMAALFIARYAFTRLGRPHVHPVLALLVGLVVLTLVGLIPVLGGVLDLVAIVFGLGAMALTLPRFRRGGGTAGTASAPVGAAAPSPLR
jgi:cytoskeletal protein CcmA (bactofilin family)